MADVLTPKQRSYNMSRIHGKGMTLTVMSWTQRELKWITFWNAGRTGSPSNGNRSLTRIGHTLIHFP